MAGSVEFLWQRIIWEEGKFLQELFGESGRSMPGRCGFGWVWAVEK